jgi:hypothetical protein
LTGTTTLSSGATIQVGTTGLPTTGTIRIPHGTTFLAGASNSGGTASLVSWGVAATDALVIGSAVYPIATIQATTAVKFDTGTGIVAVVPGGKIAYGYDGTGTETRAYSATPSGGSPQLVTDFTSSARVGRDICTVQVFGALASSESTTVTLGTLTSTDGAMICGVARLTLFLPGSGGGSASTTGIVVFAGSTGGYFDTKMDYTDRTSTLVFSGTPPVPSSVSLSMLGADVQLTFVVSEACRAMLEWRASQHADLAFGVDSASSGAVTSRDACQGASSA